jgi:acetyltransferase-like isoleucine patch superfamily enzyme
MVTIIKCIAYIAKIFSYSWYMNLIERALRHSGVTFLGKPDYIDLNVTLDTSGGLTLGNNIVISTDVVILSYDKLFDKRLPVFIGDDTFVGAKVSILPGTTIGKCCIIGAGAVVSGIVEDYSIMAGNPAKRIGDTRD